MIGIALIPVIIIFGPLLFTQLRAFRAGALLGSISDLNKYAEYKKWYILWSAIYTISGAVVSVYVIWKLGFASPLTISIPILL